MGSHILEDAGTAFTDVGTCTCKQRLSLHTEYLCGVRGRLDREMDRQDRQVLNNVKIRASSPLIAGLPASDPAWCISIPAPAAVILGLWRRTRDLLRR